MIRPTINLGKRRPKPENPGLSRRVDKAKFVSLVKEYTRPGRPAYAALARDLGKMLGVSIVLAEPLKCICGNVFVPWNETQMHCSQRCASGERVRRFREKNKAKAKADPVPATEEVTDAIS